MTFPLPLVHRQGFLLLLTAALVVLADWLFYLQPIGWTLALFGGLVVVAASLRAPRLWKTFAGRCMLLLTALILGALVEEPSTLAVIMAIVCLGTLVLIARFGWTSSLLGWLGRWASMLLALPLQAILDQRIVARWLRNRPHYAPRYLKLLFRWIVPLLAGSIFVLLFIVANPIIERWAREIGNDLVTIFDWLPEFFRVNRVILWILTGIGVYGILRYRHRQKTSAAATVTPPVVAPSQSTLHYFIIRCLVVFNLVFAIQSFLDIKYLYGGAALPPGMTHTEYVHRGAYPLIATALLAGLFVLAAFSKNGPAQRSRLARNLVYLWLAQNILLMISTIWRLWLYVDIFQLTRLRLAAMIWLLLVALGFVTLIWKILATRSAVWLWRTNALNLFATLYLCSFINFDGFIANFNVYHCHEAGGSGAPLDIDYLAHLGPEALPAMDRARAILPIRGQVELLTDQARLETSLAKDLANWRGWTLRRQRTATALHLQPSVALVHFSNP